MRYFEVPLSGSISFCRSVFGCAGKCIQTLVNFDLDVDTADAYSRFAPGLKELIGATALQLDKASMGLLDHASDWRTP